MRILHLRFTFSLFVVICASLAAADMAIKAKFTVFTTAPQPSREVTLYSKGRWLRTDTGTKTTIRDTKSGKVFSIDHAAKEYREYSAAQMLGTLGDRLKKMDIKSTAKIAPNGKSRMILGKKALGYEGTGTVELTIGGGMTDAKTTFQFEQWATTAYGNKNLMAQLGSVSSADVFADTPGFQPIEKELDKIKGLTLFSRTSIVQTRGKRQQKSTMIAEVESVKTTPLQHSIFKIPASYRRVKVERVTPPKKP